MVRGGRPLYGTAQVPAAKNSVLPLLAASLLCGGPVRLRGVPRLSDVEGCMALLRGVAWLVPSFLLLPGLLGTRGIWLALSVSELLTFLCVAVFFAVRRRR